MANTQMEVIDGEVYKSINRELKGLTDNYTYAALPTRVTLEAMKDLDPGSFTVWLHLYIQSYFKDGEITIQLREIAEGMGIAKSTVESKIKVLIEKGYLKKRQNFDTSKKHETFQASTFYVIAPDHLFNLAKASQTRAQCYKGAGQLLVGDMHDKSNIEAPIDELVEQKATQEARELDSQKANIEKKIQELEPRRKAGDIDAIKEILDHQIKLQKMKEAAEKKFAAQNTHTLTRKEGGASPENREYNKTNNSLDCFNNNRDLDTVPHVEIEDSTMISTDCSFASQEKKKETGYLKQPIKLTDEAISKIKSALVSVSLPPSGQVFQEAVFAISRRFTDKTVTHAMNVFIKLLKEGKWRTPLPMRTKADDSVETPVDYTSPRYGQVTSVFAEMRE